MALTKEQKQKSLKAIKEKISGQKAMVFADFSKIASKDLFALRGNLKDAGCDMKIGKKTLIRIALGQSGFSFWKQIKDVVPGQLALIFGIADEIAPSRISNEFAKKFENFKILGGVFENRFIGKEKVLELASIPPRLQLLGRLVGSIASPMASFVRVLDKIANKI